MLHITAMNANSQAVLVTGSGKGIGEAITKRLAELGMLVFAGVRKESDAARWRSGNVDLVQPVLLDVADERSIHAAFEQVQRALGGKPLTGIVNNAGIALYSPASDVTPEQMDAVFNIHYKGVFFLTQKSLPLMNDGGGIINISSGLARIAMPGSSVYGSLKAAVETLTRYLAKELGPRKIRVNVVAPGAIETDFGGGRVRDNKELNNQIAGFTALGRVGVPDDIGGVVAFLCTEEARWINAQRIEVSGGQAI